MTEKNWWQFLKNVMQRLLKNLYEHNVGKNAAALAYYLLFALFPLLIFASNFLGLLELNVSEIILNLNRILPTDAVGIIENYLDYISDNSSRTLMWFALVFSIWFPLRAVKGLMDDVRRAYGLGQPKKIVNYSVKQIVFTVLFLVVIVLTILLSILGENVINFIRGLLPESALSITDNQINLWQYLRFVPIALLMITAIGTLYSLSLDQRQKVKSILPGIASAVILWLILSIGFSFYVENFSSYSIIYGTLGAVMVLIVWLYMTSFVLILGAELNAAVYKTKREKEL